MLQSCEHRAELGLHGVILREAQPDAGLLFVDGHGREDDSLAEGPHRASLQQGASGHVVSEGVHDDVGCAVEEEAELVGRELVAGHPVGHEPFLELPYPEFAVASVAVHDRVLFPGCPVHDVGYDEADVVTQRADFDLYDDELLILPGLGFVEEGVELPDFLAGLLVVRLGLLHPGGDLFQKLDVPGEAGDEAHLLLSVVPNPVHELVGAELGVAAEDDFHSGPLLPQKGDQAYQPTGDVDGLVGPPGTQNGEDHLAALSLEQQQGHVAVLAVIGIEQRKLLIAERVGIGVIRVNDNRLRSTVVRCDEVVDECHADGVKLLLGQLVLQPAHGWLRGKINLIGGLASGAEFQHSVRAEPVAVIGILVSRNNLVHSLADHLPVRVNDEVLIAQVNNA